MLAEAHRVLKPGGILALDTPNANLTRLQQEAFIDPDHKYEYRHAEMAAMLRGNGFVIERAMGINYGGDSVARGVFDPTELATKRGVFDDIENCYLLAYVCRRPRRPTVRTALEQSWWRVAGTQATPRRVLGRAQAPARPLTQAPWLRPAVPYRLRGDMSAYRSPLAGATVSSTARSSSVSSTSSAATFSSR